MTESLPDDYLSDADASVVLERASELSVRRDGQIGVAELRSIAEEAGIPPEVFDRALADVRSTPLPVSESESGGPGQKRSPSLVASRWRLGIAALGGSFAALASGLPIAFGIDPDVTVVFSMILACISAAGFVAFRHTRREILEFEFDLASLWVGLTLAWMIFDPVHATDILATTGIFAGLAGGLGAILIARSDAEAPTALPPDPAGDASPEEHSARVLGGHSL
jgi:hypothetical protein